MSDNAIAFTSVEFTDFLRKNGIRHVRIPPYHPASDGLVERAVQTFKEGMKRTNENSIIPISVQISHNATFLHRSLTSRVDVLEEITATFRPLRPSAERQ